MYLFIPIFHSALVSNATSRNLIILLLNHRHTHKHIQNNHYCAATSFRFLYFLIFTNQPLPLHLRLTALDEFVSH